jgi:hypothetical protein
MLGRITRRSVRVQQVRKPQVHPVHRGDEEEERNHDRDRRELQREEERIPELGVVEDLSVGGEAVGVAVLEAELCGRGQRQEEIEEPDGDPEPARFGH